ncbi:MAG: 50S ribosomal protein L25 [Patescibacteria group bacterium]
MLTLKGEIRDPKIKPATLRTQGFIPAVFYGRKEKSMPCVFHLGEFKKVLKAAGESTVVNIQLPKGAVNALIQDVQVDPIYGQPIHVDFYVIEKGQEVSVAIPLDFQGVSPAVKDLGATLVKVLHEVEVKALPENLPHSIIVDISSLDNADAQITAGDLVLPKGVTLAINATEVVAAIVVGKEEAEETPAMDLSKIEVEKKGKKEEEAEPEA